MYFLIFKSKRRKARKDKGRTIKFVGRGETSNNGNKTRVKELMSGQSGGLSIMTVSSPPLASIRRSKQGQRATGGRTSPDRRSLTVSSPLPSNRNIIHSHRLLTVFSRLSNRPPSSRDVSLDN